MRAFNYVRNGDLGHGVCLANAKNSTSFSLLVEKSIWNEIEYKKDSALSKLSKEEQIEFILSILNNIKKEFNIEYVKTEYKNDSFCFERPEVTNLYDLYILLIFARMLFSTDLFLVRTIERMYDLKDKYTSFESYIIASSDTHYGYYTINSYNNILDIEKYRKLENKQILLNNDRNLNYNMFTNILYKKGTINDNIVNEKDLIPNSEIEEYYFKQYNNPDDFVYLFDKFYSIDLNYCHFSKEDTRLISMNQYDNYAHILYLHSDKDVKYPIKGKSVLKSKIKKVPLSEYISNMKKGKRGNYLKSQKMYKSLQRFCIQQNININTLLNEN